MAIQGEIPTVSAPRLTPAVQWLIALSVAVYFVQLTVFTPEDVQRALGFSAQSLSSRWWTIGTFMFVHGSFSHVALNVYSLWLFGPRVEAEWSSREFLRFFVCCGLGGWFAHLAFVGGDTFMIGSSAAVFGVMLAYATRWPDERVLLFGVLSTSVRWLVLCVGLANLLIGMRVTAGPDGGISYLAHLGGLAAGWLYLRASANVNLDHVRQGVSQVPDEPDDTPPRAVPRTLPRSRAREHEDIDDIVARSNAAIVQESRQRQPKEAGSTQAKAVNLDQVLEKISATGIESLTAAERALLDDASRRLRETD